MKNTVKVSQNQARELARVLYADIKEYIQNHSEEYQIFLLKEYGTNDNLITTKLAKQVF